MNSPHAPNAVTPAPPSAPFHMLDGLRELVARVLEQLAPGEDPASATIEVRLHAARVGLSALHVGLLDTQVVQDETGVDTAQALSHRHVNAAFGPSNDEVMDLAQAVSTALEQERARVGEMLHTVTRMVLDAEDLDDVRMRWRDYLSAHPRAGDIQGLVALMAASVPSASPPDGTHAAPHG